MASFVESQPVCESRVKAVGLSEDVLKKFLDQHIVTLSQLAFISSYTPGSADETALIEVFEKLLGRQLLLRRRLLGVYFMKHTQLSQLR